ncbi:MAG TPA: AMP-binding protein, partial [Burkholderiaceae bacterium]|nr:AMP-binding protein [Burkholderiaceae bacterium]
MSTERAAGPVYRDVKVGGCLAVQVEDRPGGEQVLRSPEPLQPYPARLSDRLEHWAREAPDRVFAAKRDAAGAWRGITYAQMLQRARCVGQALVQRGLSAERPVAILSDNDLEHLTLALGAMWAGVAYLPVSPAYSLVSKDYGKLRHILAVTTPGLVFASGAAYGPAVESVVGPDTEIVLAEGTLANRPVTPFEALLATPPGPEVEHAHAATGPDTIVKFLFTSGSTQQPKGVINTHRMMCSNLQMLRQAFAFLADEPPVLVDWLPWNHTFGGNHNIG